MKLPIKLDDLLRQRTVEGERIEYKAGWNPDAVLRTLCAFANDFANLGGGYVVIGQDCDAHGQPVFPPVGYVAIEEALVNAVYHRSYEEREPVEVRISRDELAILSFPGPDRSIRLADFEAGRAVSRRYRNRRIGGFLKELELTEGRSTGVPKILKAMAANGSPPPMFETDDDRAAYVIRLPVHPLAKVAAPDAQEVTTEVTTEVGRVIAALQAEMSRQALQQALGLANAEHFRKAYLLPALASGFVEMTLPDAPRSSKQRYRLTAAGRRLRQHRVGFDE